MQVAKDEEPSSDIILNARPKGFKRIEESLINYNLIAHSGRNTYVYLFSSESWAVLVSPEAQVQLCAIVGSDNASVNYLSAVIPYVNYIQKNAIRASSVPVSINIGRLRLNISFDEDNDRIFLSKSKQIVKTYEGITERVGGFCIMPCFFGNSGDVYPELWEPNQRERILKYLSPLFPNPIEFETLQWVIGNAIVDPSSISKFMILYGPGGTGKSMVISIIEDLLKGCCGTIKSSTLTDTKQDMHIDTAKAVASSRLLTAGDINLQTSKLNLHTVKELTGHDSVAVPPLRVATHCSIVAACNDLPNVREQPTWATTALSRRMVVLTMNVKASLIPKRPIPDEVDDNLDFLMRCIYTYLKSSSMPISSRCLMYTLLGSTYSEIQEFVEFTNEATMQDIFDANTGIENYFSLPLHALGELASLVCPAWVTMYSSINFIRNIRLKEALPVSG